VRGRLPCPGIPPWLDISPASGVAGWRDRATGVRRWREPRWPSPHARSARVSVRPPQRLVDEPVDDVHLQDIARVTFIISAASGALLVAPQGSPRIPRGDHRVDRVLQHVDPIRHGQRQGAAASPSPITTVTIARRARPSHAGSSDGFRLTPLLAPMPGYAPGVSMRVSTGTLYARRA